MSGYHSTFNHNNDDDYQYGLFRKQEVENATKYKNNKEGNGNNDGENVAEKLSYLTKPSPCHNLKRINLATLEPTASGQRTKINTVDTVDDFTGTLSKGKILNAAMVAHLHQLEVRNQKLEKEKTSLEHQLAHVLRRLRTDQVDDEDDNQQFNGGHHSLSNVNHQQESQGVLKVTTTSPVKKKSLNQTVSKPAPIALYDYPNDRKSLMESNSAFSLAEYSSLSDAYEDICLNKNPVDEINGSDLSEMFREKDKTLNDDTELLSSHSNCKQSSDVVYNNFNKNRNNSYEHLHKDHFSESKPLSIEVNKSEERRKSETESPLFSPDDLLIYRPDDYDNTSASQYSSSSISLSPELGIKHKTPLSHRHRFILSRNEKLSSSLSIVSYNSSTDSIVLKENKLDENGLRYAEKSIKHYSTSLPVSPIIPVSWMSKGSFLKSVEKYTKKYDRKIDKSINSSTTQSSIHPASQSSIVQESINGVNNLNVGVLETFEVSNLNVGSYTPQSPMMRPKSRNIVKGPPKVHISRKHMYHPNDSLHFSDTSSSMNPIDRNEDVLSKCSLYPTSVLFESFNGSRSIQSILPQVESSTRPKNQSRQIHSPLLSQPPYSVPANCFGRKQLVVAPQEGLPHTQIKIGSIRDFLNTKLGFSFNTDSQHLINTEKDILVLKYLSSFIKKFEVYTCVSGFAYLLQNIQPNISNLIPILQTPENSTCQEQSSSSNSEASLTRAIHISKLMIDVSKKIDPSSWLPLKPLSHELYNSDSNTPEIPKLIPSDQPYSIENIPDDSTLTLSENHAGILLKLNNHLKIWHHYWCILTLKGLFLHQCQPTAFNQVTPTNQPKKVILFSDVSRLCRPTNMSTSISQLGTLSLIRNEPSCVSSISSSSATTTITPNTTMGTRPNVSAPVSRKFAHHFDGVPKYRVERYFELVLHNNKVYRLRGINSQQTAKWISLIKDSLRINEADRILNEHSSQVIKEGWLKRVKRGSVSWFWCRLAGFYLIYSLSPNSTVPVGCKILKNAYIQLIGNRTTSSEPGISRRSSGHLKLSTDDYDTGQLLASSSDSDSLLISLTCSNTKEEHQKTIKIWTPDHEPVYLLCPTPHECEQWKDSMIRASLYSNSPVSTVNVKNLSTTKLIDKIRKIWKNLVNPVHLNSLYHSNISIRVPISKTTPNDQSTISLRLFDHLLFLCHPQVNLIENSNSPPIEIPLNTLIKCSQWLTLKHLIMKQINAGHKFQISTIFQTKFRFK
ncbi:unnamed protein product [Heterobilharzia americana]|nr:unnamed protein product [Heterobilharzia americana]